MFFDFLNYIVAKIVFFCSGVGGDSFPKPLSPEEEAKYLASFREKGDKKSRDVLIKHNLRLVAHIAKKYQGAEDQDDLISVGSIGLIKAITTFDPSKGTQLATFAARCIEKKYKNNVSLYDCVGVDKDGNELTVLDLLAEKDDGVLSKVENKLIKDKFVEVMESCLEPREYKIICLRYGIKGGRPLTQKETAKLLKISRSYISRIEKKSIEKIKEKVMAEVKRTFKPEFINRIDEIIVFDRLTEDDIKKIARLMLKSLEARLKENEITVAFTDAAVEKIAKEGFDPTYGARPLRRVIQTQIEDMLSEEIIDGDVKPGSSVTVDAEDDKFIVK